jgi:hypothetical protein
VGVVLLALLLVWFVSPVLGYAAMSGNTSGTTTLFGVIAGVGGLLAPAVGLAIGLATNRRQIAVAFAVLLTISLGVLVVLLLVT